ncbi:hypothetical protein ABPG72_017319 [Tetrahymena utriculariae]
MIYIAITIKDQSYKDKFKAQERETQFIQNFARQSINKAINLIKYPPVAPDQNQIQKFTNCILINQLSNQLEFIKSIQSFPQTQSQKNVINKSTFDPQSLVLNIFETLSPYAKEKQIQFLLKNEDQINIINQDKYKLCQALTSLIFNSLLYSKGKGSVAIEINKDQNDEKIIQFKIRNEQTQKEEISPGLNDSVQHPNFPPAFPPVIFSPISSELSNINATSQTHESGFQSKLSIHLKQNSQIELNTPFDQLKQPIQRLSQTSQCTQNFTEIEASEQSQKLNKQNQIDENIKAPSFISSSSTCQNSNKFIQNIRFVKDQIFKEATKGEGAKLEQKISSKLIQIIGPSNTIRVETQNNQYSVTFKICQDIGVLTSILHNPRIQRSRQKAQTIFLSSEFNPQNFNPLPQKAADDNNKQSIRQQSDQGLEQHCPNIELNKSVKSTFQLKNDQSNVIINNLSNPIQKLQSQIIHQQVPAKKLMSLNVTPLGSQQSINLSFIKKHSAIGNIFQLGYKGPQSQSSNLLEQKDNSPIRNKNMSQSRGSDNILRTSEILSPEKPSLPTLNKSIILKQDALPTVNGNNVNQNNVSNSNISMTKSNIFNAILNGSHLFNKLPSKIISKSQINLPIQNSQSKLGQIVFNPNDFLIQKTHTNFNLHNHHQSNHLSATNSQIKIDLREALKQNARKSLNEFSPIRNQEGMVNDQKIDNYISLRHSSLVHLDEDAKSPLAKGNHKKIIPLQTSNAMLPQSVVNSMKVLKRPQSRQTQSQDALGSPQSDQKYNEQFSQRMKQLNQMIQQQKDQSSFEDSSRISSKRTIKGIKDIQADKLQLISNENQKQQSSQQSLVFDNDRQDKSHKLNDFEQTEEQKNFQIEFLRKIRRKQTKRFTQKIQSLQEKLNDEEEELGFKGKDIAESGNRAKKSNNKYFREIFEKSLETKEFCNNDDTSTSNRAKKVLEISEDFRKLLRYEISRPQTAIYKNYIFFLSDIDPKVFIEGVVFLFQNALTISLTNNYDVKKRKYSYKIPEKFFSLLNKVYKAKILEERYQFNEAQIDRFSYLIISQYEAQQLKPQNLLEELGGAKKCQQLIADFFSQISTRLDSKDQFSDKQIQEIGICFLTNNEVGITNFINYMKRTKRILEGNIYQVKHTLYQFLYVEKNQFFEDEIKKSFLYAFEKMRYKYFTTYTGIDTEQISKDILKYFLTKKPILEYFKEENRSEKIHFLIIQVIECFIYQNKTSNIIHFLQETTLKPIDESFFLMLEPLFLEPFKRLKLGQVFTKNAEMKFSWMKIGFNILQGADQILERIEELLLNMKNWIDGMIQQKQLNKQQLSKITHIQNLSFLKYFIYHAITPDLFNNSDIYFMINTFQTSQEAVLFQLKGLKRILLHMRFKPNEAYDVAEYLIKTFNEAFQCAAPQI